MTRVRPGPTPRRLSDRGAMSTKIIPKFTAVLALVATLAFGVAAPGVLAKPFATKPTIVLARRVRRRIRLTGVSDRLQVPRLRGPGAGARHQALGLNSDSDLERELGRVVDGLADNAGDSARR